MKHLAKPKKGSISPQEFTSEFTKLVSRALEPLPPEEQDKRIKTADRIVKKSRRAISAKAREASRTPARRAARTRQ